jgi:hypothetical protein
MVIRAGASLLNDRNVFSEHNSCRENLESREIVADY